MKALVQRKTLFFFAIVFLSHSQAHAFLANLLNGTSIQRVTRCFSEMGTDFASVNNRIEALERECGEDNPTTGINVEACNRANSYRSSIVGQFTSCVSNLAAKEACEDDSGQWFAQTDGNALFEGFCRNCAAGTMTAVGNGGASLTCLCPPNSTNGQISPAQTIDACGLREENPGEECVDPGSFGSQAARDNYQACIARREAEDEERRQAEIERQRRENQTAARAEAERLARQDVDRQLQEFESSIKETCDTAIVSFRNNCGNLNLDGVGNPGDVSSSEAGSAEGCRRLYAAAVEAQEATSSEVESCRSNYLSLSDSCPPNTTLMTSTQSSTVRTGESEFGSEVVVTEERRVSESRPIGYDSDPLENAVGIFEGLDAQVRQTREALNRLNQDSQSCIAAFEQDADNAESTDWTGLAQTAVEAFGKAGSVEGSGSDDRFSSELGGSNARAATARGFRGSASSRASSGNSAVIDDGPSGFNGGGGDFDGSLSTGLNSEGANLLSNSQSGEQNQRFSGMMFPGAMGARAQGAGDNGLPATNANQDSDSKSSQKDFINSEKRNLVLGYKKVKKGGVDLTYHPKDLEKHGREDMLKLAKEAQDKFGEETPLLFKNGRFVRDYLEMKNRLAWQKYNLRQKNRLSGIFNTRREQEAKAFHQCAFFGECYTEARYNIFKLHHYKAIKLIGEQKN